LNVSANGFAANNSSIYCARCHEVGRHVQAAPDSSCFSCLLSAVFKGRDALIFPIFALAHALTSSLPCRDIRRSAPGK
jgi:hypothetical protein